MSSDTVIRTPDQRLRVFVSSTLGELADERRAVSLAISALRLTPVMFELGARPHPPQELYRAYVAQSDIFIGLYWQSYGRIGAHMEVSGLEDEFDLSGVLPRLLYVKAPAPDRELRLTELLARIQQEASYRTFRTPTELGRLVRDDLATLLSERFAATRPPAVRPSSTAQGRRSLPAAATSLFGREQAIDDVAGLLRRPEVGLVTLTGPSGIGKTRLALAVGEQLRDHFESGTAFVPLAAAATPEQVLTGIGRETGAQLTGTAAPLDALIEYLGDSHWLLILDNVEHVLEVARDLDELLARCPGVTILATSLSALQLRAEREYLVPPLALPSDPTRATVAELASSPAIALFVDRARAVHHQFALTSDNAPAVTEICRRLEGIPLAIELAAARTRLLDPDALLRRLATSLDALGTGTVDMPERHHTLRATVEWSVGLLDDDEQSLLEHAAVFADGWTVDALAEVAELDDDHALELTEALARHSLINFDSTDQGPRARMLETIHAFVAERLAARTDVGQIKHRHADHYRALAEETDRKLRDVGYSEWLERLQAEASNLATAVRWYLAHDRRPLPHMFRALWPFWFLDDHIGQARGWVEQLLPYADSLNSQARAELLWIAAMTANEVGDDRAAAAASHRLAPLLPEIEDPYLRAVSQLGIAWTMPSGGDVDNALRQASVSLKQLRGQNEPLWTALALVTVGYLETTAGRYDDALNHFTEVRDLGQRLGSAWLTGASLVYLGTLAVARGRLDEARTLLDEGLSVSLAAHSTRHVTLYLVAFARLAAAEGDQEQAALLAGAAEGLRQRVGLKAWPTQRKGEAKLVAEIREAFGSDRFDQAYAAGSRLSRREAVTYARDARTASVHAS